MTAPAAQLISTGTRRPRFIARLSLLTVVLAGALVGPAVVAPSHTAAAHAEVFDSCAATERRCAHARQARAGWQRLGFPTARRWHPWSGGTHNFAGGRFGNYEGQLPAGAIYHEYDVYPRARGASRDAYRIVVNRRTGATWFTPNHYTDFYLLT